MKVHQLRNATLVIETSQAVLLVDPMLGPAASQPPFSFFRSRIRRNPLVGLPAGSDALLERVTHCLLTHLHPDHLDAQGEHFLRERSIPLVCSAHDAPALRKKGLQVALELQPWTAADLLGGKVIAVPAVHGYGWISKPAGYGVGFILQLPQQPSLYVSGDTILTEDVQRALQQYRPDISVVAAGGARFDIGQPLLMRPEDVLRFARLAPGKVIANHLEALNHCPTTRQQLQQLLQEAGLQGKTMIPADGEELCF